jgi:hypothetical protein
MKTFSRRIFRELAFKTFRKQLFQSFFFGEMLKSCVKSLIDFSREKA